MGRKLKLVKGAATRCTLVYGIRLFGSSEVAMVGEAQVRQTDGSVAGITMHLIEGTRAQIRRQLMQSLDAFFELLDEGPMRE